AFADFNEGDINFMPTYKYDNGTDNYDTSEKNRIPAWTDRILFRGKNIQLKRYSRAEIRISDHRPVLALFSIEITKYDELAKERIKEELYTKKKLTVEVTEIETSQIAVKEGTESLAISEEIGTDCPCDVTSSTSEGDAAEATSATTKLLDNTESSQGEFSESILAPNEK
ncbi:10998_t:CDS:2, partial [Paraglomus occultum]